MRKTTGNTTHSAEAALQTVPELIQSLARLGRQQIPWGGVREGLGMFVPFVGRGTRSEARACVPLGLAKRTERGEPSV